ncbi:MAG: potassium/proton antiporter [Bacillota bacterium]
MTDGLRLLHPKKERGGAPIDPQVVLVLLIVGLLVLAGVVASKLAFRIGVPALVLFIAVGMVLGSDTTGWIYFDDAWLAQLVGTVALVQILFEGGLQTEWRQLRRVVWPALSLASVGVLVTVLVTGGLAWLALGIDPVLALLLGSIVGSTDAAAVFAVIGHQDLPRRLKYTLEAESGINDPMAVFLTLLMMEWARTGPPNPVEAVGFLLWQMGLGAAGGWLIGRVLSWALPRLRLQASGLYPILLLAVALSTFAVVSWLNGSGFVAVYILAVYLGGLEIPYRQSVLRFHEGLAWLAQIVMFIMLGLLVFPEQIPPVALPGLVIAGGLILLARPLAVWLSTLGMGFRWQERALLAWAGLRGAVPIILATYPLLAGVEGSGLIFNVVFFVVLTSAAIQGSLVSPVANWLGLVQGTVPPRPITLELVAMERLNADMIEVELTESSRATGRRLAELALPEQVTVSALYRDGRVVIPRGSTRLQPGDVLFILAHKGQSPRVRELLAGEEDEE